jgi:hypothetical protein
MPTKKKIAGIRKNSKAVIPSAKKRSSGLSAARKIAKKQIKAKPAGAVVKKSRQESPKNEGIKRNHKSASLPPNNLKASQPAAVKVASNPPESPPAQIPTERGKSGVHPILIGIGIVLAFAVAGIFLSRQLGWWDGGQGQAPSGPNTGIPAPLPTAIADTPASSPAAPTAAPTQTLLAATAAVRPSIPANPSSGYVFNKGIPLDWAYGPFSVQIGHTPDNSFWDLGPLKMHVEKNAIVLNPDSRLNAGVEKFYKVGIFKQFSGTYRIKFTFHVAFFEEYAASANASKKCAEPNGLCEANVFIGWGNPVPDNANESSGNFLFYRRDAAGAAKICHAATVFKNCLDADTIGISDAKSGKANFAVELAQTETGRSITVYPDNWYKKAFLIPASAEDQVFLWIGYDLRKPVYVEMSITPNYLPQ